MRFLIDYHHADLFESHYLLLEPLGIEVWRPIGMEWFDRGLWNFERAYHGDAVAKQYLQLWDSDFREEDNPYSWVLYRHDETHPWREFRMVDMDTALDMEWDAVISSLPDNDQGFHDFARRVGAKFGVHIGNEAQQSAWDLADFGLVSSLLQYTPPAPHVVYHQPFDLGIFRHEWPPYEPATVASFIQCFAENVAPYKEFLEHARRLPEYEWKVYGSYGGNSPDEYACGNLSPVVEVAQKMRDTRVIWHSKAWSDGFGHVIHNAFAVGRPVIGNARYYRGKLAEPLWVEGETSFDLGRMDTGDLDAILKRLVHDDEYHRLISLNAAARFLEVVDFDGEREQVREMLGRVL